MQDFQAEILAPNGFRPQVGAVKATNLHFISSKFPDDMASYKIDDYSQHTAHIKWWLILILSAGHYHPT